MFAARMTPIPKNTRVRMEQLKVLLHKELPDGHLYALATIDPKTGQTYFSAPRMSKALTMRLLEELLVELKGTRLPVRNIHHKIPVITK